MICRGWYVAHHRMMAWHAAGWEAEIDPVSDGMLTWGPPSIYGGVDLDMLEMAGCIDAKSKISVSD